MTENITKDEVLQLMKKQNENIRSVRDVGVLNMVPGDQLKKPESEQESKEWQLPTNVANPDAIRIAVIRRLFIKFQGLAFIYENFDLFVSKLGTVGLTGSRLKIFLVYYRHHLNDFQAQIVNRDQLIDLIDGFVEHMTQLETPPTKHAESRFRY